MPAKRQVRQLFDALRELDELLAGRDADAAQADIDFGEDADVDLRGAGGIGKLAGGEGAVEGHGDAGAAGDWR